MGLHSGEAHERDGDYFGPAVNRIARLLSSGHGGQVLVSDATSVLTRESLPAGATLQEIGTFRLKDLSAPQQLFQLMHPEVPSDFPALNTLDNRPNNIPSQATALIGREREIAAIAELLALDEVSLVTLTGPGGTGKTRLAFQVAADHLEQFEDGAFFVDLSLIEDERMVFPKIAEVLGLQQSSRPTERTLAEYLAEWSSPGFVDSSILL